ncbi:MAG: hypothetical protein V9H69_11240 [Anaerolineae bacterium]
MPLTDSPFAFGVAVGGVAFHVHLPNDAWLAALAPLYREFPLEDAPEWQISLTPGLDLASPAPRRIEHDGAATRFQTDLYTGWIDLDRREALTRPVSLDAAPAALESVLAYACMQTLPRTRARPAAARGRHPLAGARPGAQRPRRRRQDHRGPSCAGLWRALQRRDGDPRPGRL